MDTIKVILLLVCFVILLPIISQTVKQTFDLSQSCSLTISVCISLLSVIGINQFLVGNIAPILIPYAAMGLAMIALLALLQLSRLSKTRTEKYADKKKHGNLAEKEERPRNDERELR